jgi:hypothetical protein
LALDLPSDGECLSRERLFSTFGENFLATMGNIDPYPDMAKLTPTARLNYSIFGLGPSYRFEAPKHSSSITFYFDFGSCAHHLILQITTDL